MDISGIVSQLIAQKGGEMIAPLVAKLGFSQQQASSFVQVAISAIVGKVMSDDADEGSSFDLGSLLGIGSGPEIEDVIRDVDTDQVAAEAGVTKEEADTGMATIGPMLMDALKDQGKDALLGALLGGGDKGGDSAGGMLGKLAGGLFGN